MSENLTKGSVLNSIYRFSLPYLLSYFLQTLYGMADLYIIGQFGSVADITSVTIGSQVMHMITVMIVGLAMGSTITISRFVGAGKKKEISDTVGNTTVLFAALSVMITVLLCILIKPIINIMSTPKESFDGTFGYLTVCFLGIPFITAYNVISAVFRGMGDSKSPMKFIAVACVVNIMLDYIFMGILKMGPVGAALGTTLSQAASAGIALVSVIKKGMGISIEKENFKISKPIIGQVFSIGAPVALQDGFVQISFLIITIIANRRGLNDAAAVGIVEKIIGIIFLVPSTMLSTVSAVAAQNMGAEEYERARETLKYAVIITVLYGAAIAVTVQFCAENIVGIFGDTKDVMISGGQYLRSYVWDCIFAGIHFCFSGYFCAMKKSGISFVHNIASIVLARVPIAYFASKMYGDNLFPMGLAAPIGSVLSVLICVAAYALIGRKQNNKDG